MNWDMFSIGKNGILNPFEILSIRHNFDIRKGPANTLTSSNVNNANINSNK